MNSFEFNAKPEEWLDVTSKEEILQNTLNQTKNELETKQMELLESNVTIDLLKGHRTLLENEKESLKSELKLAVEKLSNTTKELEEVTKEKHDIERNFEEFRSSTKSKVITLEEAIASKEKSIKAHESQIRRLETDVEELMKQSQKEKVESTNTIANLSKLVEKLNGNMNMMKDASKKQAEQLSNVKNELQQSRAREDQLRQELAKQSRVAEQHAKELHDSQGTTRSVSLLAETLREKNSTLLRSMTNTQRHLDKEKGKNRASAQREATLKEEVARLEAEAAARATQEQEAAAVSLKNLEQAEDRIIGLESYAEDLKEQFAAASEAKELIERRLLEKERMVNALKEENDLLAKKLRDQSSAFLADLERAKGALGREERLKIELKNQAAAFEARLAHIRSILGVTAIAEIKSEIQTVAQMYAEHQRFLNFPDVLRSPLVIGIHDKSK